MSVSGYRPETRPHFNDGETRRQTQYHHSRSDPRMIIDVPGSKSEVVIVHLPTLWSVLK
jgi:hypothetical protein